MEQTSLLNKKVMIKSKNSFHNGSWGIVVIENVEDDEFHVAIFCDQTSGVQKDVGMFSRKELRQIKRQTKG